MIVILLFLSLFFLINPKLIWGFTYQFKLENNSVDLNFSKVEKINSNLPIKSSELNSIFSFTYKITTTQNLPIDVPVLIAVFDKKVIFSADASLADNSFHTVEIDLKNYSLDDHDQLPVFYQNNFFKGYTIDLFDSSFIKESLFNKPSIKIDDLNVIREKDNSLTIIFSVQEEIRSLHSYQLFCLDEQQKILNSVKLTQNDNFLWPDFFFLSFYANQKNELIFHLTEFDCKNQLYIIGDELFESNRTSVINLEDL